MSLETCCQQECTNRAAYKFTWPGEDEKGICESHVSKLRSVASALTIYLQIIPLGESDEQRS